MTKGLPTVSCSETLLAEMLLEAWEVGGKEAGVSLLLSQATIKVAAVRTSKVEYFNFERSKGIMLTPLSKSKTFTLHCLSQSSML